MEKKISITSRILLANGQRIPQIHLGVYETEGDDTRNATRWALEAGYRGVDSAQGNENEQEVGSTIQDFLRSEANSTGLRRQDIHFTTKLKSNDSYKATRAAIRESIQKSSLGYIDLYLLHSPHGGKAKRLECWKAVEGAVASGEIKMAGVSNFGVKHLKELLGSNPRIRPVVNQIEVHPFNRRQDIVSFCAKHDIAIQAYSPLVRAQRMEDSTLRAVANRLSCTPAQVLVRWSLQRGFVTLPKSTTEISILENAQIAHLRISDADMEIMERLDEGLYTDEWGFQSGICD